MNIEKIKLKIIGEKDLFIIIGLIIFIFVIGYATYLTWIWIYSMPTGIITGLLMGGVAIVWVILLYFVFYLLLEVLEKKLKHN